MTNIGEVLESLRIDEPLFVRNLSVFPLVDGGRASDFNPVTLKEGMESGTVSVSELDAPRVDEIIVDNMGDDPLFLLDGDEIFGARQARMTTTAALIEAETRVSMPVACIEEGRWEGRGNFEGSLGSTNPRLRSILCRGVNESLRGSQGFKAPQRMVWDEVSRILSTNRIKSKTSSFHDLARTLSTETDRYALAPSVLERAQGMIVTRGKDLLGVEYAAGPGFFSRLSSRLLTGYALDAAAPGAIGSEPPPPAALKRIISRIGSLEPSLYPAVALGRELRYDGSKFTGRALLRDTEILQASFFPAPN
jgi:hypothetical protein